MAFCTQVELLIGKIRRRRLGGENVLPLPSPPEREKPSPSEVSLQAFTSQRYSLIFIKK